MPLDIAARIEALAQDASGASHATGARDFGQVRDIITALKKETATPDDVRGLAAMIAATADTVAREMLTSLLVKHSGISKDHVKGLIAAADKPSAAALHAPKHGELLSKSEAVLDADDQLVLARQHFVAAGHAGDTTAVELLHVSLMSRCLGRPINIFVYGDSSAGKSHAVNLAAQLHPANAYERRVGGSARSLVYSDRDFRHTHIIIEETQGLGAGGKDEGDGIQASIMRSLAWGDGLVYEVTEKNTDGQFVTRKIEKEGPTGLITTGTRDLEPEMSTRMLRLTVSDSPDQTRAIIDADAQKRAGFRGEAPITDPFVAASTWLAEYGAVDVVIPYAPAVASMLPCDNVRMRRDVQQIFVLVETLAFMHQRLRDCDSDGRIVATLDDYRNAYRLLVGVMAVTFDDLSDAVREAVSAVVAINQGKSEPGATYSEIAKHMDLNPETVRKRRVLPAMRKGYLANIEERKGFPSRIVVKDIPPEKRAILPTPEEVAGRLEYPDLASGRPGYDLTSLDSTVYTPDVPRTDPGPACPTPRTLAQASGTPDTPDTPMSDPCPAPILLHTNDLQVAPDARTSEPGERHAQDVPGGSFTAPEAGTAGTPSAASLVAAIMGQIDKLPGGLSGVSKAGTVQLELDHGRGPVKDAYAQLGLVREPGVGHVMPAPGGSA